MSKTKDPTKPRKKPGPKVGQSSKKSPERIALIIKALEAGNTRQTAYTLAGVGHDAFAQWILKDSEFAEKVKAAEHKSVAQAVISIRRQGEKSWAAHAWWLERRYPHEYGNKQVITVQLEKAVTDLLDVLREAKPQLHDDLVSFFETHDPQHHTA